MADSSLKARKLADDERILCASPDYLKRYGTPQHPDDLAGHHLVGFRDQSPRELIGAEGSAGYFDPRGAGCRVVVDDGLSQKVATISGVGISMNSLWSIHREIRDGSLIHVLPNHDIKDEVAVWLVYPKSNVLTAKVRTFIDFLLEKIGKAPPWLQA